MQNGYFISYDDPDAPVGELRPFTNGLSFATAIDPLFELYGKWLIRVFAATGQESEYEDFKSDVLVTEMTAQEAIDEYNTKKGTSHTVDDWDSICCVSGLS